jgi:hypothetical protein
MGHIIYLIKKKLLFLIFKINFTGAVLACCWIDVSIAHCGHGDNHPVERVRNAEQRVNQSILLGVNRCIVSTVNM